MPQKISISRWNLGEAGLRSIGDFDQEFYPTSCRVLRNFVVSETGKIYRRPGLYHNVTVANTRLNGRLSAFYRGEDTWILLFWVDPPGTPPVDPTDPAGKLMMDWYIMVDGVLGLKAPGTPLEIYQFKLSDFDDPRPNEADLARLSLVQLENDLIITHPNMENPHDIRYNPPQDPGDKFVAEDFTTSGRACYIDVKYQVNADPEVDTWQKTVHNSLSVGGGVSTTAPTPAEVGWTSYTGELMENENNGKETIGTPPQTFKYLTCVTFAFQRLVFAKGSYVFGSQGSDPDILGIQLNGDNDPAVYKVDPFQYIKSDPFFYQAASDLGYEDFYWLASGSMLLGGANNGAWVLSNAQAGGLDATNPLMYKSTSHGAYWVPGKVVGDSMLYFQRPGKQLNEFIFSNATQNYETSNMTEFAQHLFYDSPPRAMEVQRSPFNVAWIVREDGALVSFTYDRKRGIFAWSQHPFTRQLNDPFPRDGGSAKSICIYSDGLIDRPVVLMQRENAGGAYLALEVMGEYTPATSQGIFADSAHTEKYEGPFEVTAIDENVAGAHTIHIDGTLTVGQFIRFPNAQRIDEGAPPAEWYDYIYGAWEVISIPSPGEYTISSEIGEPYGTLVAGPTTFTGIFEFAPPATENAYTHFGQALVVRQQPETPSDYIHLGGIYCVSLLDGNAVPLYVSADGSTFYNVDLLPEDWDGDEGDLTTEMENHIWFNQIVIGRSYESLFSPFVMKKQVHKGKVTKIELEVFRSLGGKCGTANVTLDNKLQAIKITDLTYPVEFETYELYDGTIKPKVVGGYNDDPLWYVLVEEAVPFNIMNVIYYVEAN
jgi:hypothetical protein